MKILSGTFSVGRTMLFCLTILPFILTGCNKPVTKTYEADFETIFPNPERGWHNRYEIITDASVNPYYNYDSGTTSGKIADLTFTDAKEQGNTLIHSYLHLDNFKETDSLPQPLLENLDAGLNSIRKEGLKIVFRPTYVWSDVPSVPEARILKHIEQINTVISKNADIIMHLEAGYLGKWGEWHSGLHTDLTNREKADTRYRIVKKILDTTPETIPVAMRYPLSLKEILVLPVPEGSEPLSQSDRDRLGHHNDCFLYNENDRGTYIRESWMGEYSIAEQKEYTMNLATSYGGNKIMGGETCGGSTDRNDEEAKTVLNEMEALNFTEININYHEGSIDIWRKAMLPADEFNPEETAFDRLSRKMGYRIRIVDATFQNKYRAGETFSFSASLQNDGFAGIIKPRPLFLTFENEQYRVDIELDEVDVRQWISGPIEIKNENIKLPKEMPKGKYTLALWLPDYYENLRPIPAYSIRFANEGIWDEKQGYNVLSVVNISDN